MPCDCGCKRCAEEIRELLENIVRTQVEQDYDGQRITSDSIECIIENRVQNWHTDHAGRSAMTTEETAKAIVMHLTGRPEEPTPMLIGILNNFITAHDKEKDDQIAELAAALEKARTKLSYLCAFIGWLPSDAKKMRAEVEDLLVELGDPAAILAAHTRRVQREILWHVWTDWHRGGADHAMYPACALETILRDEMERLEKGDG